MREQNRNLITLRDWITPVLRAHSAVPPPNPTSIVLPVVVPEEGAALDEAWRIEQDRWFRETIQPHEPNLRTYLRRKFAAFIEVDDVVQETYLRLFHARRTGKTLRPGYVFSIARHAALDLLRRRKVVSIEYWGNLERLPVVEDRPTPSESTARAQEMEILHEAIAALPERCRLIMTLQRVRGCSNQQIADQLNISIHTVNAQVVIGLARCRDYLRSRGVLAAHLQ